MPVLCPTAGSSWPQQADLGPSVGNRTRGTLHGLRPFATSSVLWAAGRAPLVPAGRPTSCALVGSGSCLKNRSLGPEIDAHDVVVRVNRLPIMAQYPIGDVRRDKMRLDLGWRTDILYRGVLFPSEVANEVKVEGLCNACGIGGYAWGAVCPARFETPRGLSNSTESCSFCTMVSAFDNRAHIWADIERIVSEHGDQQHMLIGRAKPPIMTEPRSSWNNLKNAKGTIRPSSGFSIFLVLVHACDDLTLYGFQDTAHPATMDGHALSGSHVLKAEHAQMREILRYERLSSLLAGGNRSLTLVE